MSTALKAVNRMMHQLLQMFLLPTFVHLAEYVGKIESIYRKKCAHCSDQNFGYAFTMQLLLGVPICMIMQVNHIELQHCFNRQCSRSYYTLNDIQANTVQAYKIHIIHYNQQYGYNTLFLRIHCSTETLQCDASYP